MIKFIIFDLDGVLVSTRELHFESLNRALNLIDKSFCISKEEHLLKYDGLPTTKKLEMLTLEKNLPKKFHNMIWSQKQKETFKLLKEFIKPDNTILSMVEKLNKNGLSIAVASNAVRETVKLILLYSGLMEYVEFFLSNEDIKRPKPNPEIYLKCMSIAGIGPNETLIVEDSHIGRKAAASSGAYIMGVRNPYDLSYKKITEFISKLNGNFCNKEYIPKWEGGNMNIVIPMAGGGSRFKEAGYTFPKPLVEVNGKPMIQLVVENLNINGKYIFIVQQEHYDKYNLKYLLSLIAPNCEIICIDGITEGAACTVLKAKELINNNEPLIIANSDQFIEWDSNQFMYSMVADGVDGGILTFESTHPKWSYAKVNQDGKVIEVAEKKPISKNATVGIYYWAKGSDFVNSAEQMISKDVRVNNEFYVCPVFNEAILNGKNVKIFNIEKMWGLGTPEDLSYFLANRK